MPLDKATCKNDIKILLADMRTRDVNSDEEFAIRLTDIFEAFIKSGDGVYQTGSLKAGSTTVVAAPSTIVKIN